MAICGKVLHQTEASLSLWRPLYLNQKEKKKKRDSWGLGNHGSATFLHGRIPSVPLQSFYQLQNNIGATLKDRLEVRVSSCSLFSFSWSISFLYSNLPRIHNHQGCSGRMCQQEQSTEAWPICQPWNSRHRLGLPGSLEGTTHGWTLAVSGNSSFHIGLSLHLFTELTTQSKNKVLAGTRILLTVPFHCSRGTRIPLVGRQGLVPVSSHWIGI